MISDGIFLVTGGAGSFGAALIKKLFEMNARTIRILDNDEHRLVQLQHSIDDPNQRLRFLIGNIRDRERLERAIENVDIVIHCAALKHVDLGENNPFEQIKTNVLGTQNLIEASLDANVKKFLNLSTDKAANPTSVYGACKLLAERLTSTAFFYKGYKRTIFANIRFANLIESRGNVFEIWKNQVENKKPLLITDPEMERYFISMDDAVNFTLKALDLMKGNEIFVPEAKKKKVIDIALKISKNIKIIGKRAGEKLVEVLMTEEEKKRAVKIDGIWMIPYEMSSDLL